MQIPQVEAVKERADRARPVWPSVNPVWRARVAFVGAAVLLAGCSTSADVPPSQDVSAPGAAVPSGSSSPSAPASSVGAAGRNSSAIPAIGRSSLEHPVLEHPETDVPRPTIRDVQHALIEHGYSLTADGRMGPDTKNALIRFQRKNGLAPSGLADKRTIQLLGIPIPD